MRGALLLVLLATATIGCDQATKQAAVTHLEGEPGVRLLGGTVRVAYAENPGAFLGAGAGLPDGARVPLLVAVNLVILLGLAWWALARPNPLLVRVSATLIIAGGIGNLIDRLGREGGRVVDFLVVGVGPVRTGVFNVADVALMLGVMGILWSATRRRTRSASPA
jgi:signal peptidase II